jgi:hypothetical protein
MSVSRRVQPPRRMAWVVLASAVAFAGGCEIGDSRDRGRSADCDSVVEWNGSVYFGNVLSMPQGPRAGTGTIPPCEKGDETQRVSLNRLRGVNPTIALAVVGQSGSVFLAEGFFTALASHPVHRAIQRARGPLPRPRRCRSRFERSGTVTAVRPLYVRSSKDTIAPTLHADTRITGFLRAGVPYLQVGDRVMVRGRVCAERTKWADLIRPTP